MAVTVAAQPTGLLWGVDEPMILVFSRKDGTFTFLTNSGGKFLLNGVTPSFFSPSSGWSGPDGAQIYCSPPGQTLAADAGVGGVGKILTENDYYADAGVGAGYFNDLSLNNRVDVRVKYKFGSGVTEVVTIPGYGGADGNIYMDVAEGARKYVHDLMDETAFLGGAGTVTSYAPIAQIVSIEYIEVLDGSASYTASPSTYTAAGLSVPVLLVAGARRVNSFTFPWQIYAAWSGVVGSYRWALPAGRPIFWNGNVGPPLSYMVCAHWYPTSGSTVTVTFTETFFDSLFVVNTQNITQQRATVMLRRAPHNANVATVSITATAGGQTLTAVTASVRQCVGDAHKRLLAYWVNSSGGISYALFDLGYRERTYEDRADKYAKFAMTISTDGANDFFKTQYKKANRVVVVERTAVIARLTSDEALYISDLIQARRIQLYNERTASFISPEFELKMEQGVFGYDQNTYAATLTVRYPQYGQL